MSESGGVKIGIWKINPYVLRISSYVLVLNELLEGERSLSRTLGHLSPEIEFSSYVLTKVIDQLLQRQIFVFLMKVEGDFSRIKTPLHLEKMASVFFESIPRDYAVHFNGAQGTCSVCV